MCVYLHYKLYKNKVMSIILEELKRYFQDTPQEKILSDWAELEKYDQVGPTIQEFKKVTRYFFEYDNYILSKKWKIGKSYRWW